MRCTAGARRSTSTLSVMSSQSMSRLFSLTALLVAGVLIGGCGSAPLTYVRPPVEGNAQISVDLNGGGLAYFANGDCTGWQTFPKEEDPRVRADRSFVVPSKRRMSLQAIWATGASACWVLVSMTPEVDGRYQLYGWREADKCYVEMRQGGKPPKLVAESVGLQQMEFGWNQTSCSPAKK